MSADATRRALLARTRRKRASTNTRTPEAVRLDAVHPDVVDLLSPPGWHRDAACREHPELSWFPQRGDNTAEQVRICRSCLVVDECRTYALEAGPDLAGIWGALTGRERRRIRADEPSHAVFQNDEPTPGPLRRLSPLGPDGFVNPEDPS